MSRVLALQNLEVLQQDDTKAGCYSTFSGVCSACSYAGCASVGHGRLT